jgi:hypothetical protein
MGGLFSFFFLQCASSFQTAATTHTLLLALHQEATTHPQNHHKHPAIGYQIFWSFECKQNRFPVRRYASSEWIVREKLKFLGFVQTLK